MVPAGMAIRLPRQLPAMMRTEFCLAIGQPYLIEAAWAVRIILRLSPIPEKLRAIARDVFMTPTSPDRRNDRDTSLLSKLRGSLDRGKTRLRRDLRDLLGRRTWSEATREELEERLLQADVGIDATAWLLSRLDARAAGSEADPESALRIIESSVTELLQTFEQELTISQESKPFVILVVGVNGTGKTTTFRAAAVEQLSEWGERTGATVVAQAQGADPAAVIFDALSSARARGVDVVIADTAGRLHTSAGLMDELRKTKRVMGKIHDAIPHETLLVLDASQGQNALVQATEFYQALELSGLIVTKLDGTEKGGIFLAIARQLGLPVRFFGTGEGEDDFQPFNAQDFTDALLGDDDR